jgi:hypothetical protein
MPQSQESLGRNEPCHRGSGIKYKHCCLLKDEATERDETEELAGVRGTSWAEKLQFSDTPLTAYVVTGLLVN